MVNSKKHFDCFLHIQNIFDHTRNEICEMCQCSGENRIKCVECLETGILPRVNPPYRLNTVTL